MSIKPVLQPVPQPYDRSPQPPQHLSPEAKRWWFAVVDGYDLKPHELLLLRAACECWDALQTAQATVAVEGQTFRAADGTPKPHPSVNIARDCRTSFARLVREIGLADETPSGNVRPPHLNSKQARHFGGN